MQTLQEFMKTDPEGTLEKIAIDYQVSLLTVIQALPNPVIQAGNQFDRVWNEVTNWGKVTFVVNSPDVIFEYQGNLPQGNHKHGYFNLQGKEGFSGHVKAEHCHHIAFVERKFMGVDTASIIFLNQQGQAMFKIFVGRDDKYQLNTEQLKAFHQLATTK